MRKNLSGLSMLAMIGALTVFCMESSWAQSTLNCNKCVGTGDLAKGSVSSSKLKKAAVKGNRIKDGAVIRSKIAPGAVDSSKLAPGAVTGDKLAPGAVATANIAAGAVTADKLDDDALADALILERTILVSPVGDGSDTAANGMELLDAMAALGGVTPLPSADTPWRVKIEPGIYNIGPATLLMQEFVDIEGSGQGVTTLRGNADGEPGVVETADNAELRMLRVENTGGGLQAWGIFTGLTSPSLRHVTVVASNGGGVAIAVHLNDAPTLTNVTAIATASGGARAILVNSGSPLLVNVTASALVATPSTGLDGFGDIVVRNSVFSGTRAVNASGTMSLVSTQLIGTVNGTATFACVGAYDAAFVELGPGCI